MSRPTRFKRAGCAGVALALALAVGAVPAAAQSQVNLATAGPFVVLGGQAVTNSGPSVLNGALGVSPGTSLVGFGAPAVVNGATHNNDAVAAQAQADLTAAYNVAAAATPATDLSNTDLGNRTLTAGAYRYTSSAQLTGALTLDAQGDPNAQFVFAISSALTTASASSVLLINGASPCNVYWQVGSSATLGSTTAFKGSLMALTSISLNDAAAVQGRMLARNGQVSLINNVIDSSMCATPTSAPGTTSRGSASLRRTPGERCVDGFHARVRGAMIRRVVFSMDGAHLVTRTRSPFSVFVRRSSGSHIVRARVTFRDATAARTLTLRYRACAAAVLPLRSPSQFTG
jgi:hypothetical protein